MKAYFLIGILFIGITGCTHRALPIALSHPISTQYKMQSAHHWEVLADHTAKRLAETIDLTFPNAVVKPSIFIRYTPEQEKIPFAKAFFHLLTTKLVQKGLVVVNNAEVNNVLIVDYDMQVVNHKKRRTFYPFPGTYTSLGTLFWFVGQGVDAWKDSGLAVFPLAVGADLYAVKDFYFPGETNTEVIIATTATLGQQYIFGDTNVYYINAPDEDHYESEGKTYQVVSCPQSPLCR